MSLRVTFIVITIDYETKIMKDVTYLDKCLRIILLHVYQMVPDLSLFKDFTNLSHF